MPYAPPLSITPRLIDLVSRISEALGRWEGAADGLSPKLRRENRIRSIHASLAIENNTLSLSQVTTGPSAARSWRLLNPAKVPPVPPIDSNANPPYSHAR